METANLSEIEFSEYCRQKGIYPEQVREWKEACINANDNAKENNTMANKELREIKKEKKKIEKDLARKEKNRYWRFVIQRSLLQSHRVK